MRFPVYLTLFTAVVFLLDRAYARRSEFRREIDLKKLEKDYEDDESEDWHEDTWEWKEKEKKKKPVKFDPNDFDSIRRLQAQQDKGGIQMGFAELKEERPKTEVEVLAGQWQGLLKTNAISIGAHAIDENTILITNTEGQMWDVKDFVLQQSGVEKFRWQDRDYFPGKTSMPPSYSEVIGKVWAADTSTEL